MTCRLTEFGYFSYLVDMRQEKEKLCHYALEIEIVLGEPEGLVKAYIIIKACFDI